jgi:hypothetical protein
MKYLNILIFIVLPVSVIFAQSDAELIKNEDGIKVYAQNEAEDRYKITAVTEIRGTLDAAAALMQDADNFTEWFHAALVSRKIETFGSYDFIYYLKSELPWPANNRDAVIHMEISANDAGDKLVVKTESVKGKVPRKDDLTRVENLNALWVFSKNSKGKLTVIYEIETDTPDYLPEAVKEEIYQTAPFETLKNLKEIIRKREYRKAESDLFPN